MLGFGVLAVACTSSPRFTASFHDGVTSAFCGEGGAALVRPLN
ncbi:hypothetical protein SAMN05444141_106131 [Pseudovibrio denitrificans]|uniref:Uncharacterized protein n=1 Tax=Pseudovibrio denitrificans TaxID=258256 RepID=A0A1I7CLW8_9HYPH|nr:hypothetical protein SAMN05444141_106131 [Pseudovibrio denitrificans]